MENQLSDPFNPLKEVHEGADSENYIAELLRNEVKEIIGSYHHKFDHLYECIQNAIDSCEEAFNEAKEIGKSASYIPKVGIVLDFNDNILTVYDNGIGMYKDDVLKYFFTPYATLKTKSNENGALRQRGEKGVGATFLSYGSNYIHLTTKSKENSEIVSGKLEKALMWCNGEIELLPMPNVIPEKPHSIIEESESGSAVSIKFSESTNISSLSDFGDKIKQWEAILRLHTAIGYIDFSADDPFFKSLNVTVKIIDTEGNENSEQIQTGYFYPHLTTESRVRLNSLTRRKGNLPESQRDMNIFWENYSYEQVSEFVSNRMENIPYLRYKTREEISKILNKHKPEAYVAFTYASEFWEEKNHDIWGEEIEGQFNHGIVFSTKSQKIGEQKRIDFTFRTGDFNRFFILLNMQNLKGDIGRKSLKDEIGEFANFFANSIHNKFTEQDDCLRPSPGPFDESQETNLEKIKDKAYKLDPLDFENIHIIKHPREEQDVIALFFDLLGIGKIVGYKIYSTHASRTYDGVGKFELDEKPEFYYNQQENLLGIAADKFIDGKVESPQRCFFEFKYSTDGLVKDVRNGYKRLQDIKWLICWEIGEQHIKEGIGITDITIPSQVNKREYYGITHLLSEGQDKVFVICLKKVLEIIKSQNS